MGGHEGSAAAAATGLRVLVADDDARVRSIIATLLRATEGVADVLEAADGAEAVALGRAQRPDLVVLDLNMPGLDGVEAARRLLALEHSPGIALHSADPDSLRQRAAGLDLPLFDKADAEGLLAWVERQATAPRIAERRGRGRVTSLVRKVELCCPTCGYGIVCRRPPDRCPMCGGARWVDPPAWRTRRAGRLERFAG